jgi:hypothetical protein
VTSARNITYGAVPSVETLHLSPPRGLSEAEEDPDIDPKLEAATARLKITSPAITATVPKVKTVLPKILLQRPIAYGCGNRRSQTTRST